jgi:hypothetical protein
MYYYTILLPAMATKAGTPPASTPRVTPQAVGFPLREHATYMSYRSIDMLFFLV